MIGGQRLGLLPSFAPNLVKLLSADTSLAVERRHFLNQLSHLRELFARGLLLLGQFLVTALGLQRFASALVSLVYRARS